MPFYPFKIDLMFADILLRKRFHKIRIFSSCSQIPFFSQLKTHFFSTESTTYLESETTKDFQYLGFLVFPEPTITANKFHSIIGSATKTFVELFFIRFPYQFHDHTVTAISGVSFGSSVSVYMNFDVPIITLSLINFKTLVRPLRIFNRSDNVSITCSAKIFFKLTFVYLKY
jgi:hypothetical protein